METNSLLVALIYLSVLLALAWTIFNALQIIKVKLTDHNLLNMSEGDEKSRFMIGEKISMIRLIGERISRGANSFLYQEYFIMTVFIILFSIIVLFVVDIFGNNHNSFSFYATFAFILGSFASMLCGYIGMKIAVATNFRTTFKAMNSLEEAFTISYRAGCVMGFSSVGIGLGLLLTLIVVYIEIYMPQIDPSKSRSYSNLMELVSGYGLGGSSMALFGRVGGGIFTKAADVGADLVGKLESNLAEDSPQNPATIADNVGDNVGDIAGMGSDLFGSFAEATCAALVLIASVPDLI